MAVPRRRARAAEVADAASPGDPTGTASIRRGWRAASAMRVRQGRAALRALVMEQDGLGLTTGSPLAAHGADVRLGAWKHLVEHALQRALQGDWSLPFIRRAWGKGAGDAGALPGAASSAQIETRLKHEIDAVIAAVVAVLARIGFRHFTSKAQAWALIAAAYDREMDRRLAALTDTMTVTSYNRAKVETYRERGVERVGIVPEGKPERRDPYAAYAGLLPSTTTLAVAGILAAEALRRPTGWVKNKRTGAWTFRRSRRAERALRKAFPEGAQVGVQTAEDDRVCDECDEIAGNSPYDLDAAMDLLPVHIGCRCAIVEWTEDDEAEVADVAKLQMLAVQPVDAEPPDFIRDPTTGQFGGSHGHPHDKPSPYQRWAAAHPHATVHVNPSKEQTADWRKQVTDRLTELEQAKQAGSEEYERLSSVDGALLHWEQEQAEPPPAGSKTAVSMYATTGADGKLRAAVTMQYYAPVKVASVAFGGGLDQEALTAALTTAREHTTELGAKRIEATTFDDDVLKIAAYKGAGFLQEKQGNGVINWMVGLKETPEQVAQQAKLKQDYNERVRKEAAAVAADLGFDASKIKIGEEGDPEQNFTLNGRACKAAGLAYTRNPDPALKGTIKLFPQSLLGDTAGVTAHEIEHIKFQNAYDAFRKERDAVIADPGPPPKPESEHWWEQRGGGAAVMKADGSLHPPYDTKYPIYSLMQQTYDRPSSEQFAAGDGVSDYSKEYWKQFADSRSGFDFFKAQHETLAEMARIKYTTGKFPEHQGTRDNAKVWRDLYRTVDRVNKEMIADAIVNGRPAVAMYMDDNFQPVDSEAAATLVKVSFTDEQGGIAFLRPVAPTHDVGWTEEARAAALAARRAHAKGEPEHEAQIEGFDPGVKARTDAAATAVKTQWFAQSPFKNDIEGAMAASHSAQAELGKVGAGIARALGVDFKNPGVKTDTARIAQKVQLRGGAERVTDLARAAFLVDSPGQAQAISDALGRHFEVADEHWKVTPVGYTDRALQIRFKNGLIGEVQVLEKGMAAAKVSGHELYVQQRQLDPVKDKDRFDALGAQMQETYGAVLRGYSPAWKAALGISR